MPTPSITGLPAATLYCELQRAYARYFFHIACLEYEKADAELDQIRRICRELPR